MSDTLNFIIYCIEEYKCAKNMSGKMVVELFYQYGVVDYIRKYYESLHTTGRQYTVDDIDMFIEERKSMNNG